jgi:hypothetical protein
MKGRKSMERRFEVRKEELLADCELPAGMFHGMLPRLRKFVEPFLVSLFRSEGREHAQTYVAGLLSNLERKILWGSRHRKVPFCQVRTWVDQLPNDAWTHMQVRDGDKEPLTVEIVSRRVQAKTEKRQVGPEETLVAIRSKEESGDIKHDYYLSNASAKTPLAGC